MFIDIIKTMLSQLKTFLKIDCEISSDKCIMALQVTDLLREISIIPPSKYLSINACRLHYSS